jgi:cytochrome c553
MSRIRIATFDDRARAEFACRRLVEAGISAQLHNELGVAKLWFPRRIIPFVLGGLTVFASASYGQPALRDTRLANAASSRDPNTLAATPEKQIQPHHQTPTYLRDVLPILMGKCARCHNDQTAFLQNWLDYNTASARRWEIKRRVWDSWEGGYFKQPMPTGNSIESEIITEEERTTIKHWVESGALRGVMPKYGSLQSKVERLEYGKRLFSTLCATCHQPTGQGLPGRFPPLAGSDFLNADKQRAIKVLINGLQGEVVVNGQKFNNSMPRFPLSDQDIASALTYVYNSFGNSGKEVTPDEVSTARAENEEPNIVGQNHGANVPEPKSPFE